LEFENPCRGRSAWDYGCEYCKHSIDGAPRCHVCGMAAAAMIVKAMATSARATHAVLRDIGLLIALASRVAPA